MSPTAQNFFFFAIYKGGYPAGVHATHVRIVHMRSVNVRPIPLMNIAKKKKFPDENHMKPKSTFSYLINIT